MILLRLVSIFLLIIAFQIGVARLSWAHETKRRWQHALTGHLLVQVSYMLPLRWALGALVAGMAGLVYVRYYHTRQYVQAFGGLLRANEDPRRGGGLPGAFYFLLGTTVVAATLPMTKARYALLCLSFADPMASWIGTSMTSPRLIGSASLAGSVACFLTALAVGYCHFTSWNVIVGGALACTLAEALPWGNDNLQIPIITGSVVTWLEGNAILIQLLVG